MDRDVERTSLAHALASAGLGPDDTVYFHVCLDPALVGPDDSWEWAAYAMRTAVGESGTIIVPTYSFSFCKHELFDVQRTPAARGPWSTTTGLLEHFRQLPETMRSADPIHSVTAIGHRAKELVSNLPNTCFGEGSIHDRLRRVRGKICLIGAGLEEATFQHHVEEMVGVPFRFKKLFTGLIRDGGVTRKAGWIYNVHLLAPNGLPDGSRLNGRARAEGICRTARFAGQEILVVNAAELYEILSTCLARDPWFTAAGPLADPVRIEAERVGRRIEGVELPANASLEALIDGLWSLPRDIVSDGYDEGLSALATQVPIRVHEYPTGTECWSWLVPEKWSCREAWLETMDGRRLFSYTDHPLHVVSYSLPFEGVVSRKELLEHLHVHPVIPSAIPFIFKYYERDWGLCCSRDQRDQLDEPEYRVVIRTDFSYSTLKVGEVIAKGQSEECIVLCVHLCHPHMVNDDLAGVAAGIKVMQRLLARKDLRYTYRLLIVPETIGSIAHLSHNEDLLPSMKGGLFLEMLGTPVPHSLQLSFDGNTEFDACCELALRESDPYAWTGAYRTIIGNDERQFNGPGVRVPMLSLSRVLPPSVAGSPYREYHSSADTPQSISFANLEQSCATVLKIIDTWERNTTPVNQFKGEVFCSRYGLHIDAYENPAGNRSLFNILDAIDGTRSIARIAQRCGISFDAVRGVVDRLLEHGLVSEGEPVSGASHVHASPAVAGR